MQIAGVRRKPFSSVGFQLPLLGQTLEIPSLASFDDFPASTLAINVLLVASGNEVAKRDAIVENAARKRPISTARLMGQREGPLRVMIAGLGVDTARFVSLIAAFCGRYTNRHLRSQIDTIDGDTQSR